MSRARWSVAAVAAMAGLLLASRAPVTPAAPPADDRPRSSPQRPLDLSLIQLIARPEDFDGQYVRVHGFYRAEFEGTALYLHREDYEQGLGKNGFWITSGKVQQDRQYVLVEGRFNAKRHGHLGLWSGEIDDVTRMEPWPPAAVRATTQPAR